MPPIRPRAPAPTRGQASRAITGSLATPRVSPEIRDLIRDAGGPRAAAQLVGRSERSLQRWAAGQVRNIPAHAQQTLARVSTGSRNRELIAELGGTRRAAELTGRSMRTVQRWANGEITAPRVDARRMLQRADGARRMRDRGLNIDPATGRPRGPVFLQLKGELRINLSADTGYHYPTRQVGTQQLDEISPELMAQLVDAIGQGDNRAAQQILEMHLSTEYLGRDVGQYDPDRGIGVFVDRIDQITFIQGEEGEQPLP
ncbi:MAG TPA: hypothetical protein VIU11_18810 [Nakamurella sp.]